MSWYEGTTSMEMSEHVYNCVLRKLNDDERKKMAGEEHKKKGEEKEEEQGKLKLEDVRLIDESVTPHGGALHDT